MEIQIWGWKIETPDCLKISVYSKNQSGGLVTNDQIIQVYLKN